MSDDPKQQSPGKPAPEKMMHMDLDGLRGYRAPRPLVEPRPFRTDGKGRPVAMMADADEAPKARSGPFSLEEPKPEESGKLD